MTGSTVSVTTRVYGVEGDARVEVEDTLRAVAREMLASLGKDGSIGVETVFTDEGGATVKRTHVETVGTGAWTAGDVS